MSIRRELRIIRWRLTGKYPFHSNDEFFEAVTGFVARLEGRGHLEAAADLRKGFGCLNGLTDGSALFLDAIAQVQAAHAERFTPDDQKTLETIRTVMHRAVYSPRG